MGNAEQRTERICLYRVFSVYFASDLHSDQLEWGLLRQHVGLAKISLSFFDDDNVEWEQAILHDSSVYVIT